MNRLLRSPVIHRRDEVIPTYYQLGLLHAQMGNPEEAKVFYKEAVRRDPGFALALVNLASILDQLGDKAQADDYLAKALAVDPSNGPARLNMGIRYLREGLSEDAISNLRMAMNDRNLEKNVLFYLGVAYKQKGLCGAALLHLRKALALDPMNLTVRLHLIDGYLARGLEREARIEVFYFGRDHCSEPSSPATSPRFSSRREEIPSLFNPLLQSSRLFIKPWKRIWRNPSFVASTKIHRKRYKNKIKLANSYRIIDAGSGLRR